MGLQGVADGRGDQGARITRRVGPQVDIHDDDSDPLQRRAQVALQKGGFACTAGRGEEQAVVGVAEARPALQSGDDFLGKSGAMIFLLTLSPTSGWPLSATMSLKDAPSGVWIGAKGTSTYLSRTT